MDRRGSGRLRAVDLAATAGVSVQQVRNYVDLGVLPPVERTPSGYRIFTDAHARALAVARSVADGHGWTRTREIMAAVHRGDLTTALASLDAGHAELDRERAEIRMVLGAFETVVVGPRRPTAGPRRAVRVGVVADLVGVRTSQLRLWEARGLLRPAARRAPATGCTTRPSSVPPRWWRCCAGARTRSRSSQRCSTRCGPPGARSGPGRAGPPRAGAAPPQPAAAGRLGDPARLSVPAGRLTPLGQAPGPKAVMSRRQVHV